VYDPIVPDSPHLRGAQPTWSDLPFACELLRYRWLNPDQTLETYRNDLEKRGKPNKVSQQLALLGSEKLGLLDSKGELTPSGIWIANQFEPADQSSLSQEPSFGRKRKLTSGERAIWQTILFQQDWVPMLAITNQIAMTTVSQKETDKRATDFRNRVEHLRGYQSVNSINSWKKKVQVHLQWAMYLGIAEQTSQGDYEPTPFAQELHKRFKQHYHPDWPA
jgi:hypothetical protein